VNEWVRFILSFKRKGLGQLFRVVDLRLVGFRPPRTTTMAAEALNGLG